MSTSIIGVILAGGRSSRMGHDKAFMIHNFQSFLTIATQLLKKLKLEIVISCRKDQYLETNHSRIFDQKENLGPVGGIVSVLLSHKIKDFDGVVFLPVDMPRLTPELIRKLVVNKKENIDAVHFEKFPLPVFFRLSDKLINLAKQTTEESTSVKHFLSSLSVYNPRLEESDLKNLINVNDQRSYRKSAFAKNF